jgi:hypothetical protein
MHMARRVAAWVAWAAWTCNTRTCRPLPAVPVTVKKSGLRSALFFCEGVGSEEWSEDGFERL